MTKGFFISLCIRFDLDSVKAAKVIDGRYKPYLSALDNKYYDGTDIWDAKTNALLGFIKFNSVSVLVSKLNDLP